MCIKKNHITAKVHSLVVSKSPSGGSQIRGWGGSEDWKINK